MGPVHPSAYQPPPRSLVAQSYRTGIPKQNTVGTNVIFTISVNSDLKLNRNKIHTSNFKYYTNICLMNGEEFVYKYPLGATQFARKSCIENLFDNDDNFLFKR